MNIDKVKSIEIGGLDQAFRTVVEDRVAVACNEYSDPPENRLILILLAKLINKSRHNTYFQTI